MIGRERGKSIAAANFIATTRTNAMAAAEAVYLKVVAGQSDLFRRDETSGTARDAAIATAWETYQTTAKEQRDTYRVNQAGAAATYRNAVAEAEKALVTTVSTANETATNSLQDAQATLAQERWDAWLTGAKALVNLDANSGIAKAQSLADAIRDLANEYADTHSDSEGIAYTTPNTFWGALAQKADLSADYISKTKNAARFYYGSTPWAEYVNGAVIDHSLGSEGVLDARRDYEVGVAQAQADLHKAVQARVGQRDRDFADATLQLAQARSSYETDWAALNVDSSNFVLSTSMLPIDASGDGAKNHNL